MPAWNTITSSDCVVAAAARAASCQLASLLGAARYRHTTYPKSVSSVTLRSHSAVAGSRSSEQPPMSSVASSRWFLPPVRSKCGHVALRYWNAACTNAPRGPRTPARWSGTKNKSAEPGGDAVLGAQQPLVQQLHLRPHLRGPRGTLMVHTWTTRGAHMDHELRPIEGIEFTYLHHEPAKSYRC